MSNAIFKLIESGFWDYKDTILPIASFAPLAIEIGCLAKKIFENPREAERKISNAKNIFIDSFSPSDNETTPEFCQRLVKNTLLALGAALFVTGSAAYAIATLPTALAIPIAIVTIYANAKLLVHASEYKERLIAAFTPQPGEVDASHRIFKNSVKAIGLLAIFATAALIANHIISPMLAHGFSWSVNLPFQTKEVVFAEYAVLGAIHAYLFAKEVQKNDHASAFYHLLGIILSFAFPISYWGEGMRLHHSFYGLLLMAAPSRPLKIFGSIVTFDSLLYKIAPFRGYVDANGAHWYDFINTVVDNFSYVSIPYAAAVVIEDMAS